METFTAYVPIDRLLALASGQELPNRTQGAGLFADISGFTPLTEALVRQLGPQRGAEELARRINQVYDALIAELQRFKGTVIGFSGDAITCWFDAKDESASQPSALRSQAAALRAVASALAMQKAMEAFADLEIFPGQRVSLAVKVAVAAGSARRFLVGDPQIHRIEALAGRCLDRLAAAEHMATRGEVVLDPETALLLNDQVDFSSWKTGEHDEGQFGIVCQLKTSVSDSPWPAFTDHTLDESVLRSWLLPPVYERLASGQGEFLAEFRPAVSLFLNFGGIDYDRDRHAGEILDRYIRQVQRVIDRYDGALVQITFGDKGSYLQGAFGAPCAHEDDAVRACSAALELQKLAPVPEWAGKVKIGICSGRLRTGAYGATIRRTYGVLGDEVNLAARLMQAAEPGQILVSRPIYTVAGGAFQWDERPAIQVKGKTNRIPVFVLRSSSSKRPNRLQDLEAALPLVGREAERKLIEARANQSRQNQGQIVAVTGEAGMGKSRLIAEIIRQAEDLGFASFEGEGQSYGANTSYLVWQDIWRGLFHLDPSESPEEMAWDVEEQLVLADPPLGLRTPLLGPVLGLSIPDNDLTGPLDAKTRKTSLEALLVDYFRILARKQPLLLVLENCQWMDALSYDLLDALGRVIQDLPVLLIMAYRPLEVSRLQQSRLKQLPHFSEVQLIEFGPQEAGELIHLKLEQLFGRKQELPEDFIQNIAMRSQGNPFYIEELLNYLHDQGLDPSDEAALSHLDLPASLHSLILSRIDQRTESQKTILKVASVIGRQFRAAWLRGAHPQIGEEKQVRADLDRLSQLDITLLEPDPNLSYIFRHIVTQEVAYESMPFVTRALLHGSLGHFIERAYQGTLDQYIDLLAYHYERSEELDKKREYLLKAGENAQARYANESAIGYYRRVLSLLPPEEQVEVLLKLGKVLELIGQWKEAEDTYQRALELTEQLGNRGEKAWCLEARAELLYKQSNYAEAKDWLNQAQSIFIELSDRAGQAQVFHYSGTMAAQQGSYEDARALYEQSLEIRRQLEDWPRIAALLNNLGIVARYQSDYPRARSLYTEALAIRRRMGDRQMIAATLNNLGNVALDQGDFDAARAFLEEGLSLQRQVGDRFYIANAMNNLANVVRDQGEFETARRLYHGSLAMNRDLGAKWAIAYLLEDIGCLSSKEGHFEHSMYLIGAASRLRETIGSPHSPTEASKIEAIIKNASDGLGEAASQEVYRRGRELDLDEAIRLALEEAVTV